MIFSHGSLSRLRQKGKGASFALLFLSFIMEEILPRSPQQTLILGLLPRTGPHDHSGPMTGREEWDCQHWHRPIIVNYLGLGTMPPKQILGICPSEQAIINCSLKFQWLTRTKACLTLTGHVCCGLAAALPYSFFALTPRIMEYL